MSETISRPFTFVKDGVFYFSRRIPNELKCHYKSPRIAFSLRTKSAKIAEARARKAADQLDEYWYHLRCQDAKLPGKHMLREHGAASASAAAPAPLVSSSSVLLSEAVRIYLHQKGFPWQDQQRPSGDGQAHTLARLRPEASQPEPDLD